MVADDRYAHPYLTNETTGKLRVTSRILDFLDRPAFPVGLGELAACGMHSCRLDMSSCHQLLWP